MKSKTILAAAVAGIISSAGAFAFDAHLGGNQGPMHADETTPSMGTINSLDMKTGGYKGWGPMANLQTPSTIDESKPDNFVNVQREHQQQLAEVRQVRDQVWVANAPLRSEYENIGATRSQAGGFGGFFQRDSK